MSVPSWLELVALMVDVPEPEPTLRGSIRSFDGDDESRRFHAFGWQEGTPRPVFARHGTQAPGSPPYDVWRDGIRVRINRPDGSPSLIVGAELCWEFRADGEVVVSPSSAVRYGGQGTELLWHQDGERLLGQYARKPAGPVEATTFLGRAAWTVDVGPPPGKSFLSRWVVDAATGIVLQDHNITLGSVDEWVEIVVGEPLDLGLFTWSGPVISHVDVQAAHLAEHEADMARRRSWFAAHVAPLPLRVELDVTVLLYDWDESTGAFRAGIGESTFGSLARRPRSDEPWELRWSRPGLRWSDDRWDWALDLHQETLSAAGLESLKAQLEG